MRRAGNKRPGAVNIDHAFAASVSASLARRSKVSTKVGKGKLKNLSSRLLSTKSYCSTSGSESIPKMQS